MQIHTGETFEDKRTAYKTLFLMNLIGGNYTIDYAEKIQKLKEEKEEYAACAGIKDALECFTSK